MIMKRAFSAFVIVLAFTFALAGCRKGAQPEQGAQQSEPQGNFTLPPPGAPNVEHNSYADVVARVAPAVVTIRAEHRRERIEAACRRGDRDDRPVIVAPHARPPRSPRASNHA
jgi:predicted small lipoprotein YifL